MNEQDLNKNIKKLYTRYTEAKPYDPIDGEDMTVGRTQSAIYEMYGDMKDYYADVINQLANVPADVTPMDLTGKEPEIWGRIAKAVLTSTSDDIADNLFAVAADNLDSYLWLFNNMPKIERRMSFRIPLILSMHDNGRDDDLKIINDYYSDVSNNADADKLVKKPACVAAWEASPDATTYDAIRAILSCGHEVITDLITKSGADNPNWRYNPDIRDKVQHSIALARYAAEQIANAKNPTENDIDNAIEYIKEDVQSYSAHDEYGEDNYADNDIKHSYPTEKCLSRLRDGFVNGATIKLILDFDAAANALDTDYQEALEKDLGINLIKDVVKATIKYSIDGYPTEFVKEILQQKIDEYEEIIGQ